MAVTPYDRITNLQNDQALHPSDPYPAQDMDAEYNAIKITTDDLIQHLDLIQREDGQLENDSVGLDQLREEVQIGFNAPSPWETDHDYVHGDTVFADNAFWFCLADHTSTVFSVDVTSGYWSLISDFNDAVTVGAAMYVQDGPPALPTQGQQWFESDTGNTYLYYVDPGGAPGQWVQINGVGTSETAIVNNVLVNGDFRINQGVYVSGAVLAAGAYGHDQWKAGASGGDYSFTQLKSSTSITIATGKSLIQPIEDVNVAGGVYVLSWAGTAQARAGVNTLTPSGAYAASPLTIAGQTAGTVMSVEFNAGTLGLVKLERSASASPFAMRPFDQELAACQRYFQKSYSYATAPGTATVLGAPTLKINTQTSRAFNHILYPLMRAIPVVVFYSPTTGVTGMVGTVGDPARDVTVVVDGINERIIACAADGTTPIPAGNTIASHYTANARL
jgi:hypothetical protein